MALINCPECNREISATNSKCPFCGYVLKKDTKQRTLLIAMILIVLCVAATVTVYALIIRPQHLLQQAEKLIARGKYSEADIILAELPDSEKKNGLVSQIILYEAKEALDEGNYVLAEKKISMLPPEAIDANLLYEINTQLANAILGQGRYPEADALYSVLKVPKKFSIKALS